MKKLAALLALGFSLTANAACFGSGSFQTCTDNSGNSYTVNRMGNTTQLQGVGPNGNWSQTSQTIGNTTYQNGTAVNGNTWNGTQTQLGGGTQILQGTDSNGNSYFKTCTPTGCF